MTLFTCMHTAKPFPNSRRHTHITSSHEVMSGMLSAIEDVIKPETFWCRHVTQEAHLLACLQMNYSGSILDGFCDVGEVTL